jgi:hypothetical protein
MPLPVLPKGLKPISEGYSIGDPGGVVETPVAGGRARYAQDFDRGVQPIPITLLLDPEQFSVWSAFYHHIIKKGALAFDMPIDSGFGVSPHPVNISPGSYSAAKTGNLWIINFSVKTESQAYAMTAEQAQFMIDLYNIYGVETGALLDRIAVFASIDVNILADV